MSQNVYKKVEIVGVSTKGCDDAIQTAIAEARKTQKGLSWFEVTEIRGNLQGPSVVFQVTLKLGCLEE